MATHQTQVGYDGFAALAQAKRAKSFPPNGFGLSGMAGNVWNWTADWYRVCTLLELKDETVCYNPTGPDSSVSADFPQ